MIAKGGLFGQCASHYIDDDEYAIQYIIELSDQCQSDTVKQRWGDKLVSEILDFTSIHKPLDPR